MKKFLFLGALAAMLLGTASCSNDMEPEMTGEGNVQFTIELPGNVDSRAISDGETATKLQIAVYKEDGTLLENVSLLGNKAVTMSGKTATVNFKLVKGLKYSFAFWAQNPGEDAYTFNASTGKVTVDYSKAVANADDGDAFTNSVSEMLVTGPMTETIYLYRPFAQLNYGDVEADYEAAVAAGIDFSKTQVTVKQVSTEFDVMGQKASSTALTNVTWPAAVSAIADEELNVENVNYKWLSMCYFLVPNDESNVETELALLNTAGTAFNTIKVNNVPVQKNHRTNILGNLFTEDVNFNIIIDQRFDEPDNNIIMGHIYSWMSVEDINNMIAQGGTFTLEEDIAVTNYISIPAGTSVVLDLNGHTITNDGDFTGNPDYAIIGVDGGNLTIKGNGKIVATESELFAVDVWGGNLTIEDGEYIGNEHCIYVYQGNAIIKNGKYSLDKPATNVQDDLYRYTLNLYDSNGRNGTASITVYGGEYYKFDPANNQAEGPNTNFLAQVEGLSTALVGDWYVVTLSSVTGGSTEPVGGDDPLGD